MPRRLRHIAIMITCVLTACVEPGEIEILLDSQWTVYGMLGEDREPVIFIYDVNKSNEFLYPYAAEAEIEDLNTGIRLPLVPVFAGESFPYPVQEFPFDTDANGELLYYSLPGQAALPPGPYRVRFEAGRQKGHADLAFPEPADFSRVEVRKVVDPNGQERSLLLMSIADAPGADLYKWEVTVDQALEVQVPADVDSVTGEPTAFDEQLVQFEIEATPNRYISEADIESTGNLFVYDLSANFPDFDYTEESYELHVRLRRYSTSVVEFFSSVDAQESGEVFDPFSEPVFIYSNIEGLPGIIGTYSYSPERVLEYQP